MEQNIVHGIGAFDVAESVELTMMHQNDTLPKISETCSEPKVLML